MGSLTFVSPEASAATAVVFREPRLLFADVLASLTSEERSQVEASLAELSAEHGWDLEADLFAPLGGEMAIAIDGPLVPTPSWKLVVEVYDPLRLQVGLERLVADLDARLAAEDGTRLALAQEADGYWHLRRTAATGAQLEAVYTFDDGYLVAGPSAALVDRALRQHDSGVSLLTSQRLAALLPADGEVNFSALWYQDFSSVAAPLAGLLGRGALGEQLPPELQQAIAESGDDFGRALVYAYGEDDEILVSSTSPHNPLGLVRMFLAGGLGEMI
jgi:hypothetical protein